MKCENCGFENIENAKFCINCGTKLDGQVLCPKCAHYVSPDLTECPHCGNKIPHKVNEKVDEKKEEKVNKTDRIFKLILSIFAIAIFGVTILMLIGHLTQNLSGIILSNNNGIYYYIVGQWQEYAELFAKATVSERIVMGVTNAFSTIAAVCWIVVTAIFAVRGLIRSIKSLKEKTYEIPYLNLAIIFIVNILTFILLCNLSVSYWFNEEFNDLVISERTSLIMVATTVVIIVLIALFYLTHIVLSLIIGSKKDKNYPLGVKVLGGVCFALMVALAFAVTTKHAYIRLDDSTFAYQSLIESGISPLFYFSSTEFSPGRIAVIVYAFLQLFLEAIEIAFISYYIGAYAFKNFTPDGEKKAYKIPMFFVTIAILILATITSLLPFGALIVLKFILKEGSTYIPAMTSANFVLSLTIFVCSLIAFNKGKKHEKNNKLMEKTTTIEVNE